MQHNFTHEIHCATEAHRRGNKPSCRHHLLMAIESLDAPPVHYFVLRHHNRVQLTFRNAQAQYELVQDGLPNTLSWEHPDIAEGLREQPNLDAAHLELLRVYDMGPLQPEVFEVLP